MMSRVTQIVSEADYDGVVYWDGHSGDMTGDGYFRYGCSARAL